MGRATSRPAGIGRAALRLPLLGALAAAAGVASLVSFVGRRAAGPRILRWYFQQAGGGVVKVGQLLATRYDLLPAAYCEELGRLLDDLRPVPAPQIRAAIERSLGHPVEELFSTFDDRPIGTASLAQVHGATLWSGEEVVVKVLKPGVRQTVAADLVFVRAAGRAVGWFSSFTDLNPRPAADELCRLATTELDMQREASSLAFFHTAMTKDDLPHYAPAVYRELCGADVVTMERIFGVTVRDILSAVHRDDKDQLAEWAARGITREGIARLVLRSVLVQSMRHRMFNCDPHPSNLIVSDGGQLNWIDFGLVGWMDEKQWSLQLRIRQAFIRGQVHGAYRLFLESVGPLPDRDLTGFESEMKEAIRDYILAARDPLAPIWQRSTGSFLLHTLGALRRHRLPLTTGTMQLYRAILIADIVMLRLDPQVDWLAEMQDFLVEFLAEQAEAAVRSSVEDPAGLSALFGLPSTLVEGLDWLDRRLMLGSARAAPAPSVTDEVVLSAIRLVRAVADVALVAVVLLGLGVVGAPDSGPLSDVAGSADRNPLAAVASVAVANVVLRGWTRRIDR